MEQKLEQDNGGRLRNGGQELEQRSTVMQDTLKFEQKYSTVQRAQERVSERASKQTSERSGAREQSEQCGASKRVSGASKGASDERVAQYQHPDYKMF